MSKLVCILWDTSYLNYLSESVLLILLVLIYGGRRQKSSIFTNVFSPFSLLFFFIGNMNPQPQGSNSEHLPRCNGLRFNLLLKKRFFSTSTPLSLCSEWIATSIQPKHWDCLQFMCASKCMPHNALNSPQ